MTKEVRLATAPNEASMEDVPEVQEKGLASNLMFNEETDDLLEDGEFQDDVSHTLVDGVEADVEENLSSGTDSAKQGDGSKQKMGGKAEHKAKMKPFSGGENRMSKKGTMAFPKPPAQT
ncbi:PREDICTED: uncharacterized protein LOC104719982 [Camelina sativa]|uniref:Uncharacterized protein LOC104719982 n=1 Tax=Camelina sativa TaxID=90675 RepID=A0ABM0U5S6_CAMSA|nr:PREDICTED: uncharacterized protein LOC104719982 [Camelina sativa]